MLRLLALVSLLSTVNAWGLGSWKTSCDPAKVRTQCGQYFQHCGPWEGQWDSWTDNRCYCIPGQDAQCCHHNNACSEQGWWCRRTNRGLCRNETHQCRGSTDCFPGLLAIIIDRLTDGALLDRILGDPTNNNVGTWSATILPTPAAAEISENEASETMMPITSSVALIFLSLFIGIILAYVIYKVRKAMAGPSKYVEAGSATLGDSSRQETQVDNSQPLGSSQQNLNLSPRSSSEG